MKYYEVSAKCGHVGKNYYIVKTFFVKAQTGRKAAELVRWQPRVKHHDKDAILNVEKITRNEYLEGILINNNDPYFKSKNIQQQRMKCKNLERIRCSDSNLEKDLAKSKTQKTNKRKLIRYIDHHKNFSIEDEIMLS